MNLWATQSIHSSVHECLLSVSIHPITVRVSVFSAMRHKQRLLVLAGCCMGISPVWPLRLRRPLHARPASGEGDWESTTVHARSARLLDPSLPALNGLGHVPIAKFLVARNALKML